MSALQDRGGGDLRWVFQLVAVFVFLVLPVLRSIAEARKKSREGAPGRPAKPAKAPAQRSGREQWRDLLEGRGRAAPSPPLRTPAAPAVKQAPRAAQSPGPLRVPAPADLPARPRAPVPAEPLPLEPLAQGAPLQASFTPASSELEARDIDPATLDDEMAARWHDSRPASARSPLAAALLAGLDWRSAVVLSEVLAPPLALRGRSGAWPGPPASQSA